MGRKNVVILGSTGSIGINALKVIERFPREFNVVGLTAYNNYKLLERQVRTFRPGYVAASPDGIQYLKKYIGGFRVRFWNVEEDLARLVALKEVDIVIIAMRGSAALIPFLSAVRAGKIIAPANKEALVIAGRLLMDEAKKYHAQIIPIDSEQSAIFQCLEGRDKAEVKRIHLTASGGALLNIPRSRFDRLTVRQILNHPRWQMGKKITVDSATLMNKGFEILEAMALFQLDVDAIEVVIHPEAIIHSMVEFTDGSILAQLSITDMRLPIQYALTYPKRYDTGLHGVNFTAMGKLTFRPPDTKKFPALALAIDAGRRGGTMPSVLNASDEEAVEAFLDGRIRFTDIYKTVAAVTRRHHIIMNPNLKEILEADRWAREAAKKVITGTKR